MLKAETGFATKVYCGDAFAEPKDCSAGRFFTAVTVPVDSFEQLIEVLELGVDEPESCIVRGAPDAEGQRVRRLAHDRASARSAGVRG